MDASKQNLNFYDLLMFFRHESGEKWNKLYELKRHEASVNSVCWGPMETGLVLASGSSDGSISLLKRATSSPSGWDVSVISHAHSFGCNAVTWASFLAPKPCGTVRRLASGGNDNVVKIWSETAKGWTEEAKLELHTDWVRDVAWAPFSGLPVNVIASCSQDKTVVIWTEDCT
jgi:protein transport protein SEC13